ncbi:MAG: hypothetical protein JNM89_13610 [Hyphomicrobiaceae bacterium]|nr:hypothetical protein [Hyphomicrobiaceae bacterium]
MPEDDQRKVTNSSHRKVGDGLPDTPLPPHVQARIGRQLKRAYEDIIAEPLPDRFGTLLDELAKSAKRPGADS